MLIMVSRKLRRIDCVKIASAHFLKPNFASLTRFQFGPRLAVRFFSLLMPDPPSHKQAARATQKNPFDERAEPTYRSVSS
jgi:hypothetical protein